MASSWIATRPASAILGALCALAASSALAQKPAQRALFANPPALGESPPPRTAPLLRIAPEKLTQTLVDTLVTSAKATMGSDVATAIVTDLTNKVNNKPVPLLTRFVPHPTITDQEIAASGTTPEELVFFIDQVNASTFKFEVGNSFKVVEKDGRFVPDGSAEYDPNRIDRPLVLRKAQEWQLRSYSVSHPFHIHVNPFQIVKILDPNGNDVSLPKDPDAAPGPDDEYAGLSGTWKDTIWVKTTLNPGDLKNTDPKGFYQIIVRTRYEHYIGEFVLHCHVLDHEDQGMMQNVRISIPGAPDGMMSGMTHAIH